MRVRTGVTCCALGLLALFTAATALATPFDKRTTFTFSQPVAVPGVTLPAGSYVFRIANTIQGRDVIQVLSADGRTPYAMFFSLRTLAGEPVDRPEIRFLETAADMPLAIRAWWYPAETQGYEFVYPRAQARLLAASTSILTTEVTLGEGEPDIVVEPAAPVVAREEPALVGEVAVAEDAPVIAAEEPMPARLPETGSPTANLLLLGVLALMGAAGFGAVRRVRT